MAKIIRTVPQPYPRIQDETSPFYGCLDDSTLVPHSGRISVEQLQALIRAAIETANGKSSREILAIPPNATPEELDRIYTREGRELFKYFKKYVGDPASTAHQIFGKNYRVVGIEQFRNRTLQKERMNSGWRYQYLCDSIEQAGGTGLATHEVISLILQQLITSSAPNDLPGEIEVPAKLLDSFGQCCAEAGMINESGIFHAPHELLHFFCKFSQ